MTFSKPYLSGDREYLEVYHTKTFEEGDPTGLTEYSEFQKPYTEREEWPEWEWTWPDMPFPTIPEISVPDVVPIKEECDVEDECDLAAITGPTNMECGDSANFLQAHTFIGCGVAPWWAAFGSWELTNGNGECEIVSQSAIGCRVYCSDTATDQLLILKYNGPLECNATHEITVECDGCCKDFDLTGSATVAPGNTWTGTIAPGCPGATVGVTSNSGCTLGGSLNGPGNQVTVDVGATDCGGFEVTITDANEGCTYSQSIQVRILNTGQGGSWVDTGGGGGGGSCSSSGDCFGSCTPTGCDINSESVLGCTVGYIKHGNTNYTCRGCNDYSCNGSCTPTGDASIPNCPGHPAGDCPNYEGDDTIYGCDCECLVVDAWLETQWECDPCP
jgi:hypothetical protein